MPDPLLAVRNVRAGYAEAVVLDDVSFEVAAGQSLAVLGRNGVGKSTLLLTIMGFTNLVRGSLVWRGEEIGHLAPHRRPRRGLGWVAQEREIFASLSGEENLTGASRPRRRNLAPGFELFPPLPERPQGRGPHLSG